MYFEQVLLLCKFMRNFFLFKLGFVKCRIVFGDIGVMVLVFGLVGFCFAFIFRGWVFVG